MYSKFRNEETKKEFVVSSNSAQHYRADKKITYIGQCDDKGNITLAAEEDLVYRNQSLEDQLKEVQRNLKKKSALTAQNKEFTEEDDD